MSSMDILYVGGKYEANDMICEHAGAHVTEIVYIPVTPLIQHAFEICAEEIGAWFFITHFFLKIR